ncbi:hypothetical protein DUZ99_13890 [Xylanibacillus composti]|uniref:Uncharacterized protein n=1 Tax=Xylanibacillus composti TaxID=1572762 RepID=A0A8J4H3D0_9BACL|nr:hypothetical protein [Xylanibacillus composti]MDT9726069.1 hypothetical protein [Xylanibacillus composti]GIQ68786.1 hypothetical protein XYCOK13_16100 [Xylanibacillus composti]
MAWLFRFNHILAVPFSGSAAAGARLIGLVPIDFTLDAWSKTLESGNFLKSLWKFVRTALGTIIIMTCLTLAAYARYKEETAFERRTFYIYYLIFIMLPRGTSQYERTHGHPYVYPLACL